MKIRLPEKQVAGVIAFLVRMLGRTIRVQIQDPNGFLVGEPCTPGICVVWHNQMLGLVIAGRFRPPVVPMTVLTSPSRDGELLAEVMKHFGLQAVRGSSKKRGAVALLALLDELRAGRTIIITPDGPRGPLYKLGPGTVLLAQKSGAPIFKTHVRFSNSKRLNSWDKFHIPLPFSKIFVRVDPAEVLAPTSDIAGFEAQRANLEKQLGP